MAGLDRLLEDAPRRRRVVPVFVQRRQQAHGLQQLGVALGQGRPGLGDGAFEHGPRAVQIAGGGAGLGVVAGL
ncbi:hypothetical protein [Dactylosporangium sp. CA-233914]|uniref:hypothetical protein n=1 Tax=Dactylosporangium sp. CA-233914 TaxID=3239934 RepID=UPI003D94A13A